MSKKTLSMQMLDAKGIKFSVCEYPIEERDAEKIAVLLKVDPAQVYKTLVVEKTHGKPILVMLPSNRQLDLKKLARAIDAKKVRMASHDQAESVTGLQVGGIGALALLNRGFESFIDKQVEDQEIVYVSAGIRGVQLALSPQDLIAATGAKLIDVAR